MSRHASKGALGLNTDVGMISELERDVEACK